MFIKTLKKHKKALVVAAGVLIFIALLILFDSEKQQLSKIPPVVSATPTNLQRNYIHFVNATPPSGYREALNAQEQIILEFSMPIDDSFINIISRPKIPLTTRVYDHSPNKLYVWPKNSFWEEGTSYYITIISLYSVTGEPLNSPVKYEYLFEKPKIMPNDPY